MSQLWFVLILFEPNTYYFMNSTGFGKLQSMKGWFVMFG